MEAFKGKQRGNPEEKIQNAIREFLENRGWLVLRIVGNTYQSGFPDLWASHKKYRERWIEIKLPHMQGSRFTNAQQHTFPLICANGSGVWIMTAATQEEYLKLFDSCNWWHYQK